MNWIRIAAVIAFAFAASVGRPTPPPAGGLTPTALFARSSL